MSDRDVMLSLCVGVNVECVCVYDTDGAKRKAFNPPMLRNIKITRVSLWIRTPMH